MAQNAMEYGGQDRTESPSAAAVFLNGIADTLRRKGTLSQRVLCMALLALLTGAQLPGGGYCCQAAMFAGIMELIGRVFVATVLVKKFGFIGASFANPSAWICADALLVPLFFIIIRKYEKKLA